MTYVSLFTTLTSTFGLFDPFPVYVGKIYLGREEIVGLIPNIVACLVILLEPFIILSLFIVNNGLYCCGLIFERDVIAT